MSKEMEHKKELAALQEECKKLEEQADKEKVGGLLCMRRHAWQNACRGLAPAASRAALRVLLSRSGSQDPAVGPTLTAHCALPVPRPRSTAQGKLELKLDGVNDKLRCTQEELSRSEAELKKRDELLQVGVRCCRQGLPTQQRTALHNLPALPCAIACCRHPCSASPRRFTRHPPAPAAALQAKEDELREKAEKLEDAKNDYDTVRAWSGPWGSPSAGCCAGAAATACCMAGSSTQRLRQDYLIQLCPARQSWCSMAHCHDCCCGPAHAGDGGADAEAAAAGAHRHGAEY